MDSTNNTDIKNNNTNHLSLNNQIPNYILQQSLRQYNRFKQTFKITEEEELLINSQTPEEYEKNDAIISSKISQLNNDESALLLGLLLIFRNQELSDMNKDINNLNHTVIKNSNNNDNCKTNHNNENNDKYTNENLNSLDSMFLFNNLQSDSFNEQTTHKDNSNTKITDKDNNNDSNKENIDINNRVLSIKATSKCDDVKENSKDNIKIELNTKQDTVSKKDEVLNKSMESYGIMSFNPLSTIQMNSNTNFKNNIDCDNTVIKTNEIINKNNRNLESDNQFNNKDDVSGFSKTTATTTSNNNNNNKSINLITEKDTIKTLYSQNANTNYNFDKNIIKKNDNKVVFLNNREHINNNSNNNYNNRNNNTNNNTITNAANTNYNFKLFPIIERLFQDIKSNKYKIMNLIKNKSVSQVFNNLVIQPMVLLAKGVNKLSYSEKKYIFSISDFSIILATEYDMNLVFTKDRGLYRLMRVRKVKK